MKKILIFTSVLALCAGCTSTSERESAQKLKEAAMQPMAHEAEIATQADSACPVEEPYKSRLANTTWKPVFLIDRKNAPMPDSANEFVFLHFGSDLKINGMSGNNRFGGNVVIGRHGSFATSNMFSTRRMGPYGQYEYKFLQAIEKSNRIYLSDSDKKLKLMRDKETLIEFVKIRNTEK